MATTRDLFAGHNLRCTSQRLALYEALCRRNDHPTAERLYRTAKPCTGQLSLATVYNTLEALCKAGLARKLPTNNGSCRYEADLREHLHVCFCDSDEIRDVPSELGDKLIAYLRGSVIAEIEHRLGVKVDGLNIQLSARRARPPAAGPRELRRRSLV
ncbi:MAG: Fur family transcriptional regulator [Planctomycetota bacterium]|jgi:Fe2+ or Zn2+ uptake regulation protein